MDRGSGDMPGGTPADAPIVVPNDARELARDVEAWRREQRWERRRRAVERGFSGHPSRVKAMSAPLVIAVLLGVAMLGATLAFPGGSPTRHATAPVPLVLAAPSAAPGTVGGLVPDVGLTAQTGTTPASALRPAVLAVVQEGCACAAALANLADQAAGYGLTVYLVGSPAQKTELDALTMDANRASVQVMLDPSSTFTADFSHGGLSAVGVHADGVIETITGDFSRTTSLEKLLGGLKQVAHAGA